MLPAVCFLVVSGQPKGSRPAATVRASRIAHTQPARPTNSACHACMPPEAGAAPCCVRACVQGAAGDAGQHHGQPRAARVGPVRPGSTVSASCHSTPAIASRMRNMPCHGRSLACAHRVQMHACMDSSRYQCGVTGSGLDAAFGPGSCRELNCASPALACPAGCCTRYCACTRAPCWQVGQPRPWRTSFTRG